MSRFSPVNGAVALMAIGALGFACASSEAAPRTAPPAPAADLFETEVRPVLARRCTPCHVPGGKMYVRLPFDDPETVRSHREGILRRLDGDDKAAVERWLAGS